MAVILGNGGHARVLNALFDAPMLGVSDNIPDEDIVIGVGDIGTRKHLYKEYGDRVITIIAGEQIIQPVIIQNGAQVMRGVIIQPGCTIGHNVLINTGAQIDHDCIIGDHCIISPGAILCGGVTLGHSCQIGAGVIIVQGVTLEPETIVPAGTLVVGQGDMRRPQRVVLDGSNKSEAGERTDYWREGIRSDPDL